MKTDLENFLKLLWVCLITIAEVATLRITDLIVPAQVGRGEDVSLYCLYELGEDALYRVVWFKGSHEFYRFEPKASVPARHFLIPELGFTIDLSKSNASKVTLKNVQQSSSGIYRCEITAETYEADHREKSLSVIDIPTSGPVVSNAKPFYKPSDKLSVNCTSPPSKPPATLSWIVNGEDIAEANTKRYPVERIGDYAERVTIGLEFMLYPYYFRDGILRIVCTANIGSVYNRSVEVTARDSSPMPPKPNFGSSDNNLPFSMMSTALPRHLASHGTGGGGRGLRANWLLLFMSFVFLSWKQRLTFISSWGSPLNCC